MLMNGNAGNSITVPGGTIVDLDFDIQVWNSSYCPGCKQQIVVGVDAQRTCIMDTIPGLYPGISAPASTNNSITAPAVAGTYDVYMDYLTEADCASALTAYTGSGPSVAQITTCGPVSARLYMGRLGYAGPDTNYQVLASTANDTVFYSVTGQNDDFGTLFYEIYVAPTLTFWIAETDIIEFQGDPFACVPYKSPPAVLSCGGAGSGNPTGAGCEITNIKLDGVPQTSITVPPGSTFTLDFDYQVWNTACPNCNLQIHPGAEGNFASACETVNNAGASPGTSGASQIFTLTAPSSSGSWGIFASMASGAPCDSSNYLGYGTVIALVVVP
jgi:hypothetical protein